MRSLRQIMGIVTVAALVTLPAAKDSGYKFQTFFDKDREFSGLHSYDWLAEPDEEQQDPRLANRDIKAMIRAEIDKQMQAGGYTLNTEGEADFLVNYHAALDDHLKTSVLNQEHTTGAGWSFQNGVSGGGLEWGAGSGTDFVKKYRKGTLVLDFVAPDGKELLWRGAIFAKIRANVNPEDRKARISEGVRQLLEKFPPKKK